jgi:hypothetical protein
MAQLTRLPEKEDSDNRRADGSDLSPRRVGCAEWDASHRPSQPEELAIIRATGITLWHVAEARSNPSNLLPGPFQEGQQ